MSIFTVPKSLYPLVPAVAGVPAVLRSGAQIFDTITLGFFNASDLVDSIIGSEPVLWGVYAPNGRPIANYDSFIGMDYRNDSRLSDYPIEQGAFATYNKVANPYTVQVTLACGGDINRRAEFQAALRSAQASLTLYTVVAEDGTFENCNLMSIDWGRTQQNGATIINAFCEFREVRQRGTTAFSSTAEPQGADTLDQGQIQTVDDPSIDASGLA